MAKFDLRSKTRSIIGTARGPVETDWILVILVSALTLFGLITIYSVTLEDPRTHPSAYKQLTWVGVGIAVCIVTVLIDYRKILDHAYPVFLAVVLLLLATFFLGVDSHGAKRWIAIPHVPFRIQPSEFAKPAVVLVLSKILGRRREPVGKLADLWLPACFIIPIGGIILSQPDLGTALVLIPISAGLIFAAGLSPVYFLFTLPMFLAGFRPVLHALRDDASVMGLDLKWYCIAGFVGAVFFGVKRKLSRVDLVIMAAICIGAYFAAPTAWDHLRPYQQNRVLSFLDPDADPLTASYHVRQARIALGSGGLYGKGWAAGTQSALRFLPEYETDFIYSALGEQWGFIGTGALLILFLLLILRGLAIGADARRPEGTLLALGISLYFTTHVLVNVGICLGFLPVTGLPLCFFSYGGSATLTNFIAVGLLLNIKLRRFVDKS